jgi:RNA polymerase sigma-70 factor (ECF subfamily)
LVPEPADEELLRRFIEGDERSFTELMKRHEDRIFALAYRITGQRADALEATQEAFIVAFRRASSFRGESSFGTWLYRIGINASKDLLRKRKDVPVEDVAAAEPGGHSSVMDQAAQRIDVSRALAGLPEDYREAVVMHDLGGVPYEEIARLTSVPIGTVKSRISRGRRMLAEALEQAEAPQASKDHR